MTPSGGQVQIWGIVPAAGMGRRMGGPKQSLPYRNSTIAAAVVRALLNADVTGVVVVTRTDLVDTLDLPKDVRLCVAINDDPHSEMIDSIRIGLATLIGEGIKRTEPTSPSAQGDPVALRTRSPFAIRHSSFHIDGVLVVPADMPSLSADACRKCIAAFVADTGRIVIATHLGKRGHPMIFPLSMWATVEGLHGGLRELPRNYPDRVQLIETGDPAVVHDVDTLEDYDRL